MDLSSVKKQESKHSFAVCSTHEQEMEKKKMKVTTREAARLHSPS